MPVPSCEEQRGLVRTGFEPVARKAGDMKQRSRMVRMIVIPTWLQEALGETQTPLSLLSVFGFGALATLTVFLACHLFVVWVSWRVRLAGCPAQGDACRFAVAPG